MADFEFNFPWLPWDRSKIGFELRELALRIVSDWIERAVSYEILTIPKRRFTYLLHGLHCEGQSGLWVYPLVVLKAIEVAGALMLPVRRTVGRYKLRGYRSLSSVLRFLSKSQLGDGFV